MKKTLLSLVLCCMGLAGFATTYVNVPGTDLSVAANWTTDGVAFPDGSNTAAANFNTAGDIFNLNNNPGTQSWAGPWALASSAAVTLNVNYNGGTVLLSGVLSIANATASLTVTAGATLDLGTHSLVYAPATIVNNGTIRTAATGATPFPVSKTFSIATGTVEYYGTSSQTIVIGTYAGNLIISGNRAGQTLTLGSGTVSVGNTFTYSATGSPSFVVTGNTFTYALAAGGLTIESAIPYNNLTITSTGATPNVPNGNLAVAGNLTATGGASAILNLGTNTLSVGGATITNTGTIVTQSTDPAAVSTGKTWGGTVQYAATSGGQTVEQGTYATLTLLNSTGTDNANGAISVSTKLITTSGGSII